MGHSFAHRFIRNANLIVLAECASASSCCSFPR